MILLATRNVGAGVAGLVIFVFAIIGLWLTVLILIRSKRGYVRYPPCPYCRQRVLVPLGRKTSMRHSCGNDVTVEATAFRRRVSLEDADSRLEQLKATTMTPSPGMHTPNPRDAQPGKSRGVHREPYSWAIPEPSTPRAGWYPDPQNPAQQRWWDGTQWTNHIVPQPPRTLPRS